MAEVNSALAALVTQAPDDDAILPEKKVPHQRHPPEKTEQAEKAEPDDFLNSQNTAPAPCASSSSSWFSFSPMRFFRSRKSKDVKEKGPKRIDAVMPSEPCQAPKKWEPAKNSGEETGQKKDLSRGSLNRQKDAHCQDRQTEQKEQKTSQSEDEKSASSSKSSSKGSEPPWKSSGNSSSSTQATAEMEERQQGKREKEKPPGPTPVREKQSSTQQFPCGVPQLGPQAGPNIGRKTLVLDLDETLVHSSFRTIATADIVIGVEIEGESHKVYVRKRPGCDEFLLKTAELYEIVIYTASMSKYASPLLDKLDTHGVCHWRLYREACTRLSAGYVKDLSRLGRDLENVIIIDNSPICYSLQPDNAIPIQTWRDDPRDRELLDLIPILQSLSDVDDIPQVLRQIIWTAEDEASDETPGRQCSSSDGGAGRQCSSSDGGASAGQNGTAAPDAAAQEVQS